MCYEKNNRGNIFLKCLERDKKKCILEVQPMYVSLKEDKPRDKPHSTETS